MPRNHSVVAGSLLVQQVELLVRQTTHDQVRGLAVEEIQGRVILRGKVPSQHTRQLALLAVSELLTSDRFSAQLVVG